MNVRDENAKKQAEAETLAWLEELAGFKSARKELDDVFDTIEKRVKTIAAYRHNTRALAKTRAAHRFIRGILPSIKQLVPNIDRYAGTPRAQTKD